jgi:hypothetical protein
VKDRETHREIEREREREREGERDREGERETEGDRERERERERESEREREAGGRETTLFNLFLCGLNLPTFARPGSNPQRVDCLYC